MTPEEPSNWTRACAVLSHDLVLSKLRRREHVAEELDRRERRMPALRDQRPMENTE